MRMFAQGTVLKVDDHDLNRDGQTGLVCKVMWDVTRFKGEYRTGFEGDYRLALWQQPKEEASKKEMQVMNDMSIHHTLREHSVMPILLGLPIVFTVLVPTFLCRENADRMRIIRTKC